MEGAALGHGAGAAVDIGWQLGSFALEQEDVPLDEVFVVAEPNGVHEARQIDEAHGEEIGDGDGIKGGVGPDEKELDDERQPLESEDYWVAHESLLNSPTTTKRNQRCQFQVRYC